MAKTFVIAGLVLLGLGALVWAGERWLPEGLRPFHLPGDIRIERDGMRIYVPVTTMVIVSLLLSGLAWLFRR